MTAAAAAGFSALFYEPPDDTSRDADNGLIFAIATFSLLPYDFKFICCVVLNYLFSSNIYL